MLSPCPPNSVHLGCKKQIKFSMYIVKFRKDVEGVFRNVDNSGIIESIDQNLRYTLKTLEVSAFYPKQCSVFLMWAKVSSWVIIFNRIVSEQASWARYPSVSRKKCGAMSSTEPTMSKDVLNILAVLQTKERVDVCSNADTSFCFYVRSV